MPRDDEALQRRRADAGRLARGQVVDPRDVAVGDEAAQLAFEAIDEGEGGLRRLRRVACIGVHGVHLEDRVHRLVREAPHVALARPLDPEPAILSVDVVPMAVEPSARPVSDQPALRYWCWMN